MTAAPRAHHPLRGNTNLKRPREHHEVTNVNFLSEFLREHGISPEAYAAYAADMGGPVITPFTPGYDVRRREFNALYNRYPVLIAMCQTTRDVVISMQFANSQNLQVVPKAGGHSTAGYSVFNLRLLIDVSGIGGVLVDKAGLTVSVGSGVLWGTVIDELDAFGLHTITGGCPTVGVAGYTLGGGYGNTTRQFGMGSDQLLEVTMVMADASVVVANAANNADLLWACKGGTGNNFGIVTAFKLQLYPLQMVWPISVNYPISDAANVLTVWQNQRSKTFSDPQLCIQGIVSFQAPVGKYNPATKRTDYVPEPMFAIRGMYTGTVAGGQAAMAPLLAAGTPSYPAGPLWQQQVTYRVANSNVEDTLQDIPSATILEIKRCRYITQPAALSDYQALIDHFLKAPCQYDFLGIEPYGGKVNAIAPTASAFMHRTAYFDIALESFYFTPDEREAANSWSAQMFKLPMFSNEIYQNYVNPEYENWQTGYFGGNYSTLQQIKLKYDPGNRFQFPQSIGMPTKEAKLVPEQVTEAPVAPRARLPVSFQ